MNPVSMELVKMVKGRLTNTYHTASLQSDLSYTTDRLPLTEVALDETRRKGNSGSGFIASLLLPKANGRLRFPQKNSELKKKPMSRTRRGLMEI